MKNIVLIGGSGFIGSVLLTEALSRGHKVKVIVRNPERITVVHPNLILEKGDASDSHLLTVCVKATML